MLLPLRDDNPSYAFPFVTLTLIVVNSLIYFISGLNGDEAFVKNIYSFGLISNELFHGEILETVKLPLSADNFVIIQTVNIPTFATIFTSMFMHGGFMHLLGNMWFLWLFGDNIEDRMGGFKFFLFYIITGVIAALAHALTATHDITPMIGASGAISGVTGAYIILYPNAKIHTLFFFIFITTFRIPAFIFLGFWFIGQVYSGFLSFGVEGAGIAFFAHIGGFIAGMVLVKLFINRQRIQKYNQYRNTWE